MAPTTMNDIRNFDPNPRWRRERDGLHLVFWLAVIGIVLPLLLGIWMTARERDPGIGAERRPEKKLHLVRPNVPDAQPLPAGQPAPAQNPGAAQ